MSDSLRDTLRLMADGWQLRGRSDRRGKLPPSYHLTRGDGEEREVRSADAGQVKRLVSLRWIAESGREGDDSLYTLTGSGKGGAAKGGPPAGPASP